MKVINNDEYIWAEKYRPQCIDDLVLPDSILDKIKEWVSQGEIPNLGLWGLNNGTGKTSICNAIMKELNTDILFINASKDNGIDYIRNRVTSFANTVSFSGAVKIVVYDESDHLSQQAQATLRSDLEKFSKTCRFIFTGNYPERIIDPLKGRLQNFNLDEIYQNNKQEIGRKILQRLEFILQNENLEYDKQDVIQVIKAKYPSLREMVITLQQNSSNGKFKLETLSDESDVIDEVFQAVYEKDFYKVRSLITKITMFDVVYTTIWKNIDKYVIPQAQPQVIILLSKYQHQNYFAKNKEINLMAFFTELLQLNINPQGE